MWIPHSASAFKASLLFVNVRPAISLNSYMHADRNLKKIIAGISSKILNSNFYDHYAIFFLLASFMVDFNLEIKVVVNIINFVLFWPQIINRVVGGIQLKVKPTWSIFKVTYSFVINKAFIIL